MNATILTHAFIRSGAVLTLSVPGGSLTDLVIASEFVLKPRALIYHVVGQDYTRGVHRLDFDEIKAPHALGVEFIRRGEPVAYLCPVAEDSEESVAAWKQWQSWLADHRAEHVEAIAAEFRKFREGD